MPRIRFTKLHGLGNDFILFDGMRDTIPPDFPSSEDARRLCQRGFGVGADGLLVLLAPSSSEAKARMRVLNADGSEPEMCGNGLRCLARYLLDAGLVQPRGPFWVETGAGLRRCEAQGSARVSVDMGRPSTEPADLPLLADEPHVERPLISGQARFVGTAVSMGNPHFVIYVDDTKVSLEQLAREHGPSLERHAVFPRRANIEFARIRASGDIEAWVWERGSGITRACGTGACAVVVAGVLSQRFVAGTHDVTLPGGVLRVDVNADLDRVQMTGPAVEVYRGELTLDRQA